MFRPEFTVGEGLAGLVPGDIARAVRRRGIEGAIQGPVSPLEASPAPWGFPPAFTADQGPNPVLR